MELPKELMPTKIELVSFEINELHILIKLLLSADNFRSFDVSHNDVIDLLNMMDIKFKAIDKKFEEIDHEQRV
ncbi:hypothetical protein AADZ86_15620 [Colwelliaceae bacterium BS250]